MEIILQWFMDTIGQVIPRELLVFLVSICPVLELRAGMVASMLLKIPLVKAIILCIVGNILPMPIWVFVMKKLFAAMRRRPGKHKITEWFARLATKKQKGMSRTEFWGLVAFVGIPVPGTGGWTGGLIAAALDMDLKKAVLAMFLGMCIAMTIMCIVSYGVVGHVVA